MILGRGPKPVRSGVVPPLAGVLDKRAAQMWGAVTKIELSKVRPPRHWYAYKPI